MLERQCHRGITAQLDVAIIKTPRRLVVFKIRKRKGNIYRKSQDKHCKQCTYECHQASLLVEDHQFNAHECRNRQNGIAEFEIVFINIQAGYRQSVTDGL